MPLLIDAPHMEERLNKAAAKKGIQPIELAVQILSNHLGSEAAATNGEASSIYATSSPEQWIAEFDAWVAGHPKREPLAANAFDRSTFYEGRL